MSKTLYLTDLDGTLLDKQRTLSPFTAETIQMLIDDGVCFSYATARSVHSASTVLGGICPKVPVICFNGTFLCDHGRKTILSAESFTDEQRFLIRKTIDSFGLSPLIFSIRNGEEKVTRMPDLENLNEGVRHYLCSRPGDRRQQAAGSTEDLYSGDVFHYTFFGEEKELRPAAEAFAKLEGVAVVLFQELDRPEWLCELMPEKGQKSHSALKLKELLGCDRIVVFGDGVNDLPMFEIADECYAVANAVPELKAAATGMIGSNEEDGVAHWLLEHAGRS